MSSVAIGVVVAITLLWLTPLLWHLPQATLAAVTMMAVINLIKIEPIVHAWKAQPHDGIVSVITFVLTLLWAPHLDKGIIVGVVLSLGLFLMRTMRPRVAVLSRYEDGTMRDVEVPNLPTSEYISLVRFDGSLYFGNAGYFETKLLEVVAANPKLRFIIARRRGHQPTRRHRRRGVARPRRAVAGGGCGIVDCTHEEAVYGQGAPHGADRGPGGGSHVCTYPVCAGLGPGQPGR